MIEYEVKKGDSLFSLSQKLGLPNAYSLKNFHNFKGPIENGIGNDIREGMILTIPEPHEVEAINKAYATKAEEKNLTKETDKKNEERSTENSEKSQNQEEQKNDSKEKASSEHEGKLFVAQKGKAICDKGTKFPQFKVTSHKKLYINDKDGVEDFLAVTENDIQFNPPAVPFGNCSLKNNQPCSFAAAGKWQKFYKDVKVDHNSLLTEISELQCTIGGKIKVLEHGQKPELSKQNFKNADPKVHGYINPLVDLNKFVDNLEYNNSDFE